GETGRALPRRRREQHQTLEGLLLHERAGRERLVERKKIGSGCVGAAGGSAANGEAAPVLAAIGLVAEREAAIFELVVGVVNKTGCDTGLREHLVVHVVVVVPT